MAEGQYTHSEILSQPEVWADVLDVVQERQQEIAARWRLAT